MHRHLRSIIKEKNPNFYLLSLIERFLSKIKEEHNIYKIKDLEHHLIHEARLDSRLNQNKIEFINTVKELIKAYELAYEAHKSQNREDGSQYITHPIHSCLNEIYHQEYESNDFNKDTIISALLHDTIEDTDTKYENILQNFGIKIGTIVNNLTDNPKWKQWYEEGNISKLEEAALQFVNSTKLEESLRVKFDDRLANLKTIDVMPEEKIVQKIIDTICVGYIERAEDLKEIRFLKVLLRAMDKYLTKDNIKKYYNEDLLIESVIEKARKRIYSTLLRLDQ